MAQRERIMMAWEKNMQVHAALILQALTHADPLWGTQAWQCPVVPARQYWEIEAGHSPGGQYFLGNITKLGITFYGEAKEMNIACSVYI